MFTHIFSSHLSSTLNVETIDSKTNICFVYSYLKGGEERKKSINYWKWEHLRFVFRDSRYFFIMQESLPPRELEWTNNIIVHINEGYFFFINECTWVVYVCTMTLFLHLILRGDEGCSAIFSQINYFRSLTFKSPAETDLRGLKGLNLGCTKWWKDDWLLLYRALKYFPRLKKVVVEFINCLKLVWFFE